MANVWSALNSLQSSSLFLWRFTTHFLLDEFLWRTPLSCHWKRKRDENCSDGSIHYKVNSKIDSSSAAAGTLLLLLRIDLSTRQCCCSSRMLPMKKELSFSFSFHSALLSIFSLDLHSTVQIVLKCVFWPVLAANSSVSNKPTFNSFRVWECKLNMQCVCHHFKWLQSVPKYSKMHAYYRL